MTNEGPGITPVERVPESRPTNGPNAESETLRGSNSDVQVAERRNPPDTA